MKLLNQGWMAMCKNPLFIIGSPFTTQNRGNDALIYSRKKFKPCFQKQP
jgi:hypothetical protein